MKIKSEKGSYTIEACISLFAFLITIYVVFLQINTMIAENILQKAANNVALEISSFSYILDRTGIIPSHDKNEMQSSQNAVNAGKNMFNTTKAAMDEFNAKSDSVSSFVKGMFEDPQGVNNVGASMGQFIDALKGVDWSADLNAAGRYVGEQYVKSGINWVLSSYYDSRVKSGLYLPQTYDKFCRYYNIKDLSFDINFMPDDSNNTVLVVISCNVYSPIRVPGFEKKTIVKTSYSPLWVK